MQIGSVGTATVYQPLTQIRPNEAVERGPDRDNDGDEIAAAAQQAVAAPPPGRGKKVDMFA